MTPNNDDRSPVTVYVTHKYGSSFRNVTQRGYYTVPERVRARERRAL